ncbi:MAG: DNA/RNA nuclease SfsA [Gammaproteobacteria bacterium]
MEFRPPLSHGIFIKRYKRFMADVRLPNGDIITLHCPNTGSMKNCLVPDAPVWYSHSENPKRKYPCTWEIAEIEPGVRVGVNTHGANVLVQEAITNGVIKELQGYSDLRREVPYGEENSRIDFLLRAGEAHCYVEVKNVTLWEDDKVAYFPDAISARGTKHLRELISMVEAGHRAVLLFCVQHTGATSVAPADHIDPLYGETLRLAAKAGVELLAYQASITPEAITLKQALPVKL